MENTETLTFVQEPDWSWIKKWLFRFIGTYLVLFIFPFPISYIPGVDTAYESLLNKLVNWVGHNVLHIQGDIASAMTGSGDRTYDYVLMLILFVLALLISMVWTVLDRRSAHYRKHYHWLMVYVRYYLGMILISYGFAKVIKTQFPYPGFVQLLKPLGDASPMGLAWTFMGYSPLFNLFTGLGEVIGGFLLFFRRTTTIGAFLLISVLATVVMMNFSYDIPVKLYSTHLLLMSVFLLTPDFKRLYHFFISNKQAEPAVYTPHFTDRRWNMARWVVKILFIAYVLISNVNSGLQRSKQYGDLASRPPLYGAYLVTNFVLNGDTLPPLMTDDRRWKHLLVDRREGFAFIQFMSGKYGRYNFATDTSARTISMNFQNSAITNNLTYTTRDTGYLHIQGILEKDTVDIDLKKKGFLLVDRGFHWINERPYNR
ncbi:MAG: hypothetical protein R2824_29240 [Saprospiraceae bacterium]|nr:DoxX family protein [Lewinella sp.]